MSKSGYPVIEEVVRGEESAAPIALHDAISKKIRQAVAICTLIGESEEESPLASDAMSLVCELLQGIDCQEQALFECAKVSAGAMLTVVSA
ncbi:hypothetical protein AWB78_07688 [Caballeronia calidae]|uniref:Uncharacterized protein n=1 Tax=Caballeronia calidae TaxID=1777139 RepID=A0A158EG24_9BURK|nr:hypothetical protein [Caballeronia calidae]SAL05764.1 hypothetical protein AWB78_07688 [Caballeronia calidae]